METTKESIMKKGKRPKSATRYPKRMPTYVVAFAVQESHDDPPTNQQIPKKRSFETGTPSIRSISPCGSINSSNTFTITPTEKRSHDIATISEVKIDIIDENQCGDVEKKSPQISSYFVLDNRMADEQPEIIFNASKHIKKSKENNKFTRKKPRKNKRVIKFKNVHFKYKNPKNNISRRLEKYYEKTKMNSPNAEQIQKQICSNVLSKVVSRSRVLKKVLAKENLLDEAGRISFSDGTSVNDFDDGSLSSSPSTTKKSFVSHTSQNTLVRKGSSTSSRNDDFYSIKTANSVIQVSSDITPYKTDIVNIAVAVAFNSAKPKNNTDVITPSIHETFMQKVNLTSQETFFANNTELTSETPSEEEPKYFKIKYDELPPMDLDELTPINHSKKEFVKETPTMDSKNMVGIMSSEDDTFVIARTSSDFNKSSINSGFTFTSNSDTTLRTEIEQPLKKDEFATQINNLPSLLDKVINLGLYPGITPSTSSGANFENELNDVSITDKKPLSFTIIPTNKGDDLPEDFKNNLTMLRNPYEVDKVVSPQKLPLPNEVPIKTKFKDADRPPRRTGADEVRNKYPTDLGEMWERLTLVLDLAVQRLETTLADKIAKDVKASLAIFNQQEYRVPKLETRLLQTTPVPTTYERPIPVMSHKEVFVEEDHLKQDTSTYVQCDLVHNHVIDQLMHHLSVDGQQLIPTSSMSLKKLMKPQLIKDYYEILKTPTTVVDSTILEVGRGDTVTVSTATAEIRREQGLAHKILFSGTLTFIRENLFILTSVPTFFVVLLCLYGILLIIMKPM